MTEPDPVISFLISENAVDVETIDRLLETCRESGHDLLEVLRRTGDVDEELLARASAVAGGFEFVDLTPDKIDPLVAHLVPQEAAHRLCLIPLRRDGQQLLVAMSAPLDLRARDEVELKTGYRVLPVAATVQAVRRAIHYHFDVASVTRQAIASMRLKGDPGQDEEATDRTEEGPVGAGDDPVSKLVGSIIRGAVETGASDIHIEPQASGVRVRYRVDGMLRPAVELPLSAQAEVLSHIKILAEMDISEKRLPQDGHIALRHEGREYDLRVCSLPAVGGEKIVLRILAQDASRWSLDAVVTSADDNRRFRELVAHPHGMLLLTGPTGSGKTTTLYSVLQLVNTPQRNIVTVEDPVEYRLPGVTQVQVRRAAGMTFASALRSILRQDPDVILIGEIRDLETAEIAVSAALTGHLVLSTLHTNDAAGAVSRLISIGIPPFLVASALLGAVAQRLVRTNCPKCTRQYSPQAEERELLAAHAPSDAGVQFSRGVGCDCCFQTGYQGRKAIYEILAISPAIRRLILDRAGDTQLNEQAIREGMQTLRLNAMDEVRRGVTTIDELMRVVDLKSD